MPETEGRYFLPYIVLSEFLVGMHRPDITSEEAETIRQYAVTLKNTIPFIPFNYKVAEIHASLFFNAKNNDKRAHDTIIAAIAIAYECKLVTRNVSDFTGIMDSDSIINTSAL
ncbi:MAG: PIN domain-containing protein [Thiohalomonadales bacterium]